MVIFSHRGIGFGNKENSIEAISRAVKEGFSVEVDLRLKDKRIVLAHDFLEQEDNLAEFDELLELIRVNAGIFFALHLKEDSQFLFEKISETINPFNNCFLFVTDFKQEEFIQSISSLVGRDHLALYVNDNALDLNLLGKVSYLWLDETKKNIYADSYYFTKFKKRVIFCSPELYCSDYKQRFNGFKDIVIRQSNIFGICTDFAESFIDTYTVCPICKSGGPFSQVDQINGYELLLCSNCALEFSKPMQCNSSYYKNLYYNATPAFNDLEKLTREDYLEIGKKLSRDKMWMPYSIALQWLRKYLRQGDAILDVGCGNGWFLASLEVSGFKAIGVEVSEKMIKILTQRGFNVFHGPLEECKEDFSVPKAVTIFEVIEHITNPLETLREVSRKFPDAPLIISVPNFDSWTVNLGIRSYCDYPPNHLTRWSEKNLKIALQQAGYSTINFIYPLISSTEVYGGILNWMIYLFGLRRKGYLGELKSINEVQSKTTFAEKLVRFLYPMLNCLNTIAGFLFLPFGEIIAFMLNKKGFTSYSMIVIAQK